MSNEVQQTEEEERFWRELDKPTLKRRATSAYEATSNGGFYSPHQVKRDFPKPEVTPKTDAVNPDHYKRDGGIECIDGIRSALTPEEFRGYCKGSAMAYLWRDGKKDDPLQEASKANWYVTWLQGKDPRK